MNKKNTQCPFSLFSLNPARRFQTAAALIGFSSIPSALSAVNVTDSTDFTVTLTSADTVVIDCDPDSRAVRVVSEGSAITYTTRCQQLETVTVDARLDNATATIDTSALAYSDTATITITILGSTHDDTLIGPQDTAGTVTVNIVGDAGNDTITVGGPQESPADANSGTITIEAGPGDDDVSVWRRSQLPEATAANAIIDLGDGNNTLVVVSDNVDVTGGADTDDVTLCGCWGAVQAGLGADDISITGFNNVAVGGPGSDLISVDAECTATATLVVIAPPTSSATIDVDGADGPDQISSDIGDTASVTITISDSGGSDDTDTLTITAYGGTSTATATLTVLGGEQKVSNSNGNSEISFGGMEDVAMLFGDQAGPDGDSLTLNVLSTPGYSLTIDGGLPDATATPGDTLITNTSESIIIQGFETVATIAVIPLVPLGGLLFLAGSLSLIGIRNSREANR